MTPYCSSTLTLYSFVRSAVPIFFEIYFLLFHIFSVFFQQIKLSAFPSTRLTARTRPTRKFRSVLIVRLQNRLIVVHTVERRAKLVIYRVMTTVHILERLTDLFRESGQHLGRERKSPRPPLLSPYPAEYTGASASAFSRIEQVLAYVYCA